LGDLNVDGRIILKCVLNKEGAIMRIGFSWCRTQTNGGLLQTRYRNLGFEKAMDLFDLICNKRLPKKKSVPCR
jgi:hypothetical protein